MPSIDFLAFSAASEIDLNRIAFQCGISKKFTWEEALSLRGPALTGVLGAPAKSGQSVMLFSFGSIVLINLRKEVMSAIIAYLRQFGAELFNDWQDYTDDYALHVSNEEQTLTDEYAVVDALELYDPELVADVLAKSVALERVEAQLGKILDSLESYIERLEKGDFKIGDKKLAKVTARVARHEFNSVSYIMILDKPDITWVNSRAAEFYNKLSEFFELSDRYEIIKSKSTVCNNIITGFSSISHAFRGLRVELIIVLLIVVEVVLMILELLK